MNYHPISPHMKNCHPIFHHMKNCRPDEVWDDNISHDSYFLSSNSAKFLTIIDKLPPHTHAINITVENYDEVWPTIFPHIKEIYENATHEHFQHCSIEDQLNEVRYIPLHLSSQILDFWITFSHNVSFIIKKTLQTFTKHTENKLSEC